MCLRPNRKRSAQATMAEGVRMEARRAGPHEREAWFTTAVRDSGPPKDQRCSLLKRSISNEGAIDFHVSRTEVL